MAKLELAFINIIQYEIGNPDNITKASDLSDEDFYKEAKRQDSIYPLSDFEEDWANGCGENIYPENLLRIYPRNHFRKR